MVDGLGAGSFRVTEDGKGFAAVLREVQAGLTAEASGEAAILGSWRAADGGAVRFAIEDGRFVGRATVLSADQQRAGFVVGEAFHRLDAEARGSWLGESKWQEMFFGTPYGDPTWRATRYRVDGDSLVGQDLSGDPRYAIAAAERLPPYALGYEAEADGATTRTVEVRVGKARASASFDVPEMAQRAAAPLPIGLSLAITVNGETITRTLAGAGAPMAADDPGVADAVAAVEGAMLGGAMLSFEGPAPTFATWLDDLLSAKLELAPALEAGRAHDSFDALQHGIVQLPPEIVLLQSPVPGTTGGEPPTFEIGPRVVLYAETPRFGEGIVMRSDVLAFAGWDTAADDRAAAFRSTLRRSMRVAVLEASLFETSTLAALRGKKLSVVSPPGFLPPGIVPDKTLSDWSRRLGPYGDRLNLVPSDGVPGAFWSIDPMTGSVLGILDDGSGGGTRLSARETLRRLDEVWDVISAALGLGAFLIGTSLAVSVWVAYYKAIARQVLKTAIVLEELVPVPPSNPIIEFTCELAKREFRNYVAGGAGEAGVISLTENSLKLAGGPSLSCDALAEWSMH